MGLAEKRATKKFQDGPYQAFLAEMKQITGMDVSVEVKWEELAREEGADRYEAVWTRACFHPLLEALRSVCADDLGRDSLRETLRRVEIHGEYAHAVKATFADGTLLIDFSLWNPPTDEEAAEYTKAITECLERGL